MATDSGTYDEATIARKQKIAQALFADSMKPQKVEHWAQGLAQMARAGLGGYLGYQADEEARLQKERGNAELYAALGLPSPPVKAAEPSGFSKIGSLLGFGTGEASIGTSNGTAPVSPESPTMSQTSAVPASPHFVVGPMGNSAATAISSSSDANLPRGLRNMNPGNIEDGPFARSQPGYSGTDGRFAKFASMDNGTAAMGALLDSYGKRGLNTVNGIINRWAPSSDGNNVSAYAADVSGKLGIGPDDPITPEMRPKLIAAMAEHENGVPLPPSSSTPTVNPVVASLANPEPRLPPQIGQASLAASPTGGMLSDVPEGKKKQIAAMLTSSNPTVKALGVQLLGNYTKADQPTDEVKEYRLAQSQGYKGSFVDYKMGLKKAGAQNISIDQKPELAFDTKAGQLQAERFNSLAEDGQSARQMVADINTLTDLGRQIGTGKGAQVLAALGPYADALGVKVKGLDEVQAYEAIVNRLAPNLRVKGSGAQSDYELRNFLKSLPNLGNTPEGNEISSAVLKGLYENKIRAAEIGADALNKKISRSDAEKALRELPDPMEPYRAYRKAHPEQPKAPSPAAAPQAPAAGAIMDGFRFKGGDPSKRENWEPVT